MPYNIGLDRGHGGADPGAVKFVKEVDVATILTKQLEAMLQADDNYVPVIICPYEKGLGIMERAAQANKQKLDLLISNHFNAGGGNGWEVYPEVPRKIGHPRYTIHQKSLAFAQKLAELTSDIQQLRGDRGIQYKYADKDAYFGVIRLVNSPAVLVESAFVDNQADISDFDSPQGLLRLAGRQYAAICSFFGTTPLFDKEGRKIGEPLEPVRPKYRVFTEKASFDTMEKAVECHKTAGGIIICGE